MRGLLAVTALIGLTACVSAEKRAEVEVDLSKRLSPGCYTVDLFDPYRIEYPLPEVPAVNRKFLGVWKNGAWGDSWCHDLYITQVYPDGSVDVIDAYGPKPNTRIEAHVFKRKGKIENGVLSFYSKGQSPVTYRLVGEFLVGERLDAFGKHEITMSREFGLAEVPIPPRNPRRS